MDPETQQIAQALHASRKYRHLCSQTLDRLALWAAQRGGSQAQAVKTAKRKLHQVYAAYLSNWNPRRAEKLLASLGERPTSDELRSVCRQIMSQHSSTAERLDYLADLYAQVFRITGKPARILDIGCGLAPFALPWMDLDADVACEAWDIDHRMVDLLNHFFQIAAPRSLALCKDILTDAPTARVDAAFLMKLLPCLEQQQPGISAQLLATLQADFLVVSFPVHSIGGRDKNMPVNYSARFEVVLAQMGLKADKLDCPAELIYVVDNR